MRPKRTVALAIVAAIAGQIAFAGTCDTIDGLENFQKSGLAPMDADCTTYLSETGTMGTSCHWSFPFREKDALNFADTLWQKLGSCRPGTALGADQPVNHPDSYDLREWSTPGGIFALSVKDKGGLNRTLVFFRLEPSPG